MQFKNPDLLYALFLLLIPIIIHLFQLRRFKKEAFTNVAFLKKISIQTRKSSRLKKWLTLLTRLLALAAIILAFAQPFSSKSSVINTVSETVIWLDNSFSMQKKGPNGELLKRAVQELIENTEETKTFTLFTNDVVFKNTNIKAIQNDLLQLEYSPKYLDYNAALLKGKQLFNNNNSPKELVLISDFQEQETIFQLKSDSLISTNLVKLNPVNINNVVLDSLYLTNSSPTKLDLAVVVKNYGENIQDLPISLFNENKLIAKTSVTLNGENTAQFTLPTNEEINGRINIDDSSLSFDNTFYFNINKRSKINVLVVSGNSDGYLKRIFSENEFNYQNFEFNELDFNTIDQQNMIVLNELENISNALSIALQAFQKNGGTVIVIPQKNASIQSYNVMLSNNGLSLKAISESEKRITSINYDHPIYKDVFDGKVTNFQYPKVESFFSVEMNQGTDMISFEDGKPFLIQQDKIYLFTAPLNNQNSNFIHSDLVVSFYAMAKNSLKHPELYYTIGNQNTFDIDITLKQDEVIGLVGTEESVIPQQQYYNSKVTISTSDIPETDGIYAVVTKTDTIQNVSFNYSRKESKMVYQSLNNIQGIDVSDSVSVFMDTLKNESKIKELWKWFVIFALIFLVIEMLILKYLK